MVDGALSIEEPTVADLATGTPTTTTINILDQKGADGTTITQINYDNGTVFTLDQSDTGEQKFVVAEGSIISRCKAMCALNQTVILITRAEIC